MRTETGTELETQGWEMDASPFGLAAKIAMAFGKKKPEEEEYPGDGKWREEDQLWHEKHGSQSPYGSGAPEAEDFGRAGGQRTYGGRLETNILGMKEYHEYLQPGDNPPMNKYYGDEAQAAFDRADGGEATPYGGSGGGRDPYEGH